MGLEHEFKCDECAAETNGHICERCLAKYHEQTAEIERLQVELADTRNAIKLLIAGCRGIRWTAVAEDDVDSYLQFVREQREAAEAGGE